MYNIVICEDEDIIRKGLIFSFDFNELGINVVADFDNPIDCLNYIEENDVDIIITDIKMPFMTGIEMINKIKDKNKCEYIILSGYSDFEYAKQAISIGVTEYLLKPLDHKLLEKSLRKAVLSIEDKQLLKKVKYQVKDLSRVYQEKNSEDELLNAIIQYIKTNYMNKIGLKEVAKNLNYSVSTIKNKLQEHNMKFNTILNSFRIYKAIKLMNIDKYPIYEIAVMVGFNDYKYFCKRFKSYTGYSISEFIKQ